LIVVVATAGVVVLAVVVVGREARGRKAGRNRVCRNGGLGGWLSRAGADVARGGREMGLLDGDVGTDAGLGVEEVVLGLASGLSPAPRLGLSLSAGRHPIVLRWG
jgi:hypothetical protein